jgi:hypothetical protein
MWNRVAVDYAGPRVGNQAYVHFRNVFFDHTGDLSFRDRFVRDL